MTHGSLFAGIGGFDLGFERAGIETLWQVEIDDYCQKVLAKHWPDVERFGDIRDCGRHNLREVDIISGGFPCQDISVAGKQAGIDGSRSGLWSEMHRIIGELRPRYAVIENVPNLIRLGLDRVFCNLAEIGYDAEWQVIGADDVGAPHRRKRIWIVAYPQRIGRRRRDNGDEGGCGRTLQTEGSSTEDQSTILAYPQVVPRSPIEREQPDGILPDVLAGPESTSEGRLPEREGEKISKSGIRSEDVANTSGKGLSGSGYERGLSEEERIPPTGTERGSSTSTVVVEEAIPGSCWSVEPDVGRVAHGVPARVDRLKGLGNAIVPQIAEIIGRMIIEDEA